jgi:hypothetical protein
MEHACRLAGSEPERPTSNAIEDALEMPVLSPAQGGPERLSYDSSSQNRLAEAPKVFFFITILAMETFFPSLFSVKEDETSFEDQLIVEDNRLV